MLINERIEKLLPQFRGYFGIHREGECGALEYCGLERGRRVRGGKGERGEKGERKEGKGERRGTLPP